MGMGAREGLTTFTKALFSVLFMFIANVFGLASGQKPCKSAGYYKAWLAVVRRLPRKFRLMHAQRNLQYGIKSNLYLTRRSTLGLVRGLLGRPCLPAQAMPSRTWRVNGRQAHRSLPTRASLQALATASWRIWIAEACLLTTRLCRAQALAGGQQAVLFQSILQDAASCFEDLQSKCKCTLLALGLYIFTVEHCPCHPWTGRPQPFTERGASNIHASTLYTGTCSWSLYAHSDQALFGPF